MTGKRSIKKTLMQIVQRFLVPQFLISLYYYIRFGVKISPRAEVELSGNIFFGLNSVVGSFTKIKSSEGAITFGERSGVATGCFISGSTAGIKIGKNFVCGPNVNIIGSNYMYEKKGVHLDDQGHTSKGIVNLGYLLQVTSQMVVISSLSLTA